MMAGGYVELHAKSFYSFGLGASHTHELLARAREYSCDALALTDTNLCGALEFARLAGSLGIQPVTGGELTLTDGSRLVLLARTRDGYANISRLFTLANTADRREPKLDPRYLSQHTAGVVLLTGGRGGPLDRLLTEDRRPEALRLLRDYLDWFGKDSVFVELQQNFLQGDAGRNRELASLAAQAGAPLVATNDVHYHDPDRYRLQHALVAAKHNTTMDQALPFIHPNRHLCLKSPQRMAQIFEEYPEAVANTRRIAGECRFNLSADLGYTLPEPDVPPQLYPGHLPGAVVPGGGTTSLRLDNPGGGSSTGGGVQADWPARPGRVPAAVPGNCPAGPANHGGAGALPPGNTPGGTAPGPGPRLLGGPAGGLPHRHQPRGSVEVGPHPGAVHLRGHQPAPGHRPGLPAQPAGRTHHPGCTSGSAASTPSSPGPSPPTPSGALSRTWAKPWGCPGRSLPCCPSNSIPTRLRTWTRRCGNFRPFGTRRTPRAGGTWCNWPPS